MTTSELKRAAMRRIEAKRAPGITGAALVSIRARRMAASVNRLAKGSTHQGIVETLLDLRAFCRLTGYDFDEALEQAKADESLENAMRREGLIE